MAILIMVYLILGLLGFTGWAYNIIWLFHQNELLNVLLGILGAVVPPVGVVHGLYLLF